MKTLEQLEKELKVAQDNHSERFKDAPPNMGWSEFDFYMSATGDIVQELHAQIRLIKEPKYSDMPDYGDVMPLSEFIEYCNDGSFIDYDGSGNYVKDGKMSNIDIYPSDVKKGNIRKEFDTIIWFNR